MGEPELFSVVLGFAFAWEVVLGFVVDFAVAAVRTAFFDLASFVRDTFAAPFRAAFFFAVTLARRSRLHHARFAANERATRSRGECTPTGRFVRLVTLGPACDSFLQPPRALIQIRER